MRTAAPPYLLLLLLSLSLSQTVAADEENGELSQAPVCGTAFLPPLKNAFYYSWNNSVVTAICSSGHFTDEGESSMEIICQSDNWDPNTILECRPKCGWDGAPCSPETHFCDPLMYPDYNITFGRVSRCPNGYQLKEPVQELQCSQNFWDVDKFCEPICGSCGPGGLCIGPNKCLCTDNSITNACHGSRIAVCDGLPANAVMYPRFPWDEFGKVLCPVGYTPEDGSLHQVFDCSTGSHNGSSDTPGEVSCLSSCPCLNGGVCNTDGLCQCPRDFHGPSCERERCPLPIVSHATVTHGSDGFSATITCSPDYQLADLNSTDSAETVCFGGQWSSFLIENGCVAAMTSTCPQIQVPDFIQVSPSTSLSSPPTKTLVCTSSDDSNTIQVACHDGKWVDNVSQKLLRALTLSEWQEMCMRQSSCPPSPPLKKHMKFTSSEFDNEGTVNLTGTIQCTSGYTMDAFADEVYLRCSSASSLLWVLDSSSQTSNTANFVDEDELPDCLPLCQPPCLNGGACRAPGSCLCSSGFEGPRCGEKGQDFNCPVAPPVVPNADIYYNGSVGVVECQAGHELPTGLTHYHIACNDVSWNATNQHGGIRKNDMPACSPVCRFQCLNGGTCVAPNKCSCPPDYKGLNCQVPRQKKCTDAPKPVPNAIIILEENSRVLRCSEGYQMRGGLKEALIWCREGHWVYPQELYLRDRDENELDIRLSRPHLSSSLFFPCTPVCDPPCINRGLCIRPGQCKCPPSFQGVQCEKTDHTKCWGTPPPVKHAVITYSSVKGTVTCESGYSLPGGIRKLELSCSNGAWVVSTGQINDNEAYITAKQEGCQPICPTPCEFGGRCVAPHTCQCPEGRTGHLCQQVTPKPCLKLMAAKSNAKIAHSTGDNSGSIYCNDGFSMQGNLRSTNIECVDGSWVVVGTLYPAQNLTCSPHCPGTCLNGGTCLTPNSCHCREGFTGKNCHLKTCRELSSFHRNATVIYDKSSQVLSITCNEGYRMRTGDFSAQLTCDDGVWRTNTDTWQVECLPSCLPPCLNGGRCVAPFKCQCPPGYTGVTCNKRYSLTVEGTRCVFPFVFRGKLQHACVSLPDTSNIRPTQSSNDSAVLTPYPTRESATPNAVPGDGWGDDVPWCPTTVDYYRRPVRWEVCAGVVGEAVVARTVSGERCIFPFTYEGISYRDCTTAGNRGQDWCATAVDGSGIAVAWDFCDLNHGVEGSTLTYEGKECHFPFRYEGKWHDDCLAKFSTFGSWCATEVTTSGDLLAKGRCIVHWGFYRDSLTQLKKVCAPSFSVDGFELTGCQIIGQSEWCATSVNSQRQVTEWSYCDTTDKWPGYSVSLPDTSNTTDAEVYTVTGDRCLPHSLVGVHGCLVDGSLQGFPWCPLSRTPAGLVERKGLCLPDWHLSFASPWQRHFVDAGPKAPHSRQSVGGQQCVIPFKFEGKTYLDCAPFQNVSGDSEWWCAAAVNPQMEVFSWQKCKNNQHSAVYQGPKLLDMVAQMVSTEQKLCVFPFKFEGFVYFDCVNDNSSVNGWCATSVLSNGEVERRGNCPPVNKDASRLPEVIKSCTEDLPMAAVHPFATAEGPQCVVPFVFHNKTFWDCTSEGSSAPWCATQVNGDKTVRQKQRCTAGWYLKPNEQIQSIDWQRDWLLDLAKATLHVGTSVVAWSNTNQRVDTISGKHCVFPYVAPGLGEPQWGCAAISGREVHNRPSCATKVDDMGTAISWEPCRGLLIRQRNYFDEIVSH